jgi:hypothetical protein
MVLRLPSSPSAFWHDVNAQRRRGQENEHSKCDDTETCEIAVCHAIKVSRNKASVRAEERIGIGVLLHTAHVVGSRERGRCKGNCYRRSNGRTHGLDC